jgi:predicted transcriptional regulator
MNDERCVKDVMNPDIMTVADDMTTDELARYLTEREISGAPVVNSQGDLVGVVSMTDIGRQLAEPSEFVSSRRSEFYDAGKDAGDDATLDSLEQRFPDEGAVAVREVMTPVVHHVPATAPIAEAARIMVEHHIHRLVVTQAREPVGIITSMDLLRVVAER